MQQKIQEMQGKEQQLQRFSMQKQTFQAEAKEANSALEEVKDSEEDELYKIAGQVMIKSKKEDLVKELEEKKKTMDLRVNSIEKQEKKIKESLDSLKGDVEKALGSGQDNQKDEKKEDK